MQIWRNGSLVCVRRMKTVSSYRGLPTAPELIRRCCCLVRRACAERRKNLASRRDRLLQAEEMTADLERHTDDLESRVSAEMFVTASGHDGDIPV